MAESISDCFKLNDGLFPLHTAQDDGACEHGRIEEKNLQVLDVKILEGLVDLSKWVSVISIAKMNYTSEVFGKKSTEIRYYILAIS